MTPGLWQSHLTLALLVFLLVPNRQWGIRGQLLLLLALAGAGFPTIDGLTLPAWFASFTGQFSTATMLLLSHATLVRIHVLHSDKRREREVLFTFGMLSWLLYPAALGLTYFDPYRLGYEPRLLLALTAFLALLMLVLQNRLGAWVLALATFAFAFHLQASANYWDYLIDPFLALYCLGAAAPCAARALQRYTLRKSCGQITASERTPAQ